MKIVYIPYSHGTSFFEHIIKVHLQTQLKASRKVSLVSVFFFCNFFEWLCESLYTLNVCVCAVTLSECPCIVPCSTHWCACIHNSSVLTRFIDLPLYYHTWWCSCQCFFLFVYFQGTGWSAPLSLDWLTASRTCWISARWIDSPSYVRVQRSARCHWKPP